MKVKLTLLLFLLTGCASENYTPNKWYYMGPDYVDCTYDIDLLEICRKMGPYMICECRYV